MFTGGGTIIAYAIVLVLVFVACLVFIRPLKWILKIVFNAVLGGLILSAVNFAGGFAGIYVIISPIASIIAGMLGVPGVILVIALQYMLL
jgi:inhibitor of the pro-sigma K processing machinery